MSSQKRKTYSEKLRDPRWQKARLRVLERDKWTCQACLDTEKTLHVHHRTYFPGRDPWDYQDCWLVTLCESCHRSEDGARKLAEYRMQSALRRYLFSTDVTTLADALHDGLEDAECVGLVVFALARLLRDKKALNEFADTAFSGLYSVAP